MATFSLATQESPETALPENTKANDRFEDVLELSASFFSDSFSKTPPRKTPEVPELRFGIEARLNGIAPQIITDSDRPYLIGLCKLALDTYNAENKGAKFKFAELSHSKCGCCHGMRYFITFKAKDAAHPPNNTYTFYTKVWHKSIRVKPEVIFCRMIDDNTPW